MANRIGVGLIGCGGIARAAHLPALQRLADRLRLVAVADVNEQAAAEAATPWAAAVYTDYEQLLARKDVDLVIIATPEFFHREQVVAAAAAKKHILCEKPMAPTLAEADDMLAACKKAGVRLMIGHSRRFTSRYLAIRQAVERGEIGAVRLFRENERRARPPLQAVPAEASYGVVQSQGYWTGDHWTGDPQVSLGVALTNGIHEADLMRWFFDAEPVAVAAEHKVTVQGNRGVPDFLTFTVQFANGAIGSAEIANCIPPGYPAFHQFELYGTAGCIRAMDLELLSIAQYHDTGLTYPASDRILWHNPEAYVRQLASFAQALREDGPTPMPAEEARAALRLALATIEAAKTGHVVHLSDA